MEDKEKKTNVFIENMSVLATPEGIQKYILGTKKSGQPRALYDIFKDFKPDKKKKKNKKKGPKSTYEFYLSTKKKHKGKKKKNKKDKYWHI